MFSLAGNVPALLTVADDIDANLYLSGYGVFNRNCNRFIKFSLVVRLLPLLCENQVSNVFWPWQTAYMCGQNSVQTMFHTALITCFGLFWPMTMGSSPTMSASYVLAN